VLNTLGTSALMKRLSAMRKSERAVPKRKSRQTIPETDRIHAES
jgi:hypothetical protein